MAKYDRDILKMPVDVIDNGTRKHWDTREEAIAQYLDAMIFCEGSAKERYSTIYTGLKYGTESVVSDGEPEIVAPDSVVASSDKAKLLEMIENDEININSEVVYDRGACKLVVEDRDIIKALLKQDGWYAAQFLRKYIENDKELLMAAALGGDDPRGSLAYAGEQLQDDKEFVLEMIKLATSDVRYVSDRLSNDPEVIATALEHAQDSFDIDSVKDALGTDLLTEMVKLAVQRSKTREAQGLDSVITSAEKLKTEKGGNLGASVDRENR